MGSANGAASGSRACRPRRPPGPVDWDAARAVYRDKYISLEREQGNLLYLLARSLRATRAAEFGTSFGISTIYLAAAMRDNGGGLALGSEIEPTKAAVANENLALAGLAQYAEVRVGDARETLADPGGPLDLVLIDGFPPPQPDDAATPRAAPPPRRHRNGGQRRLIPQGDGAVRGLGPGSRERLSLDDAAATGRDGAVGANGPRLGLSGWPASIEPAATRLYHPRVRSSMSR